MDGRPVTVAKLRFKDSDHRHEVVERLAKVARASHDDEPGTLKYAILTPREDDGKTVWVCQEFADHASSDLHLNSPQVLDINNWLIQNPAFFDGSRPIILNDLESISSDFGFTRPQVRDHQDLYVVIAEITYMLGGFAASKPYWEAVVESSREGEPGTLSYGVLKDLSEEEKLATFEAYESQEYLNDVHAPSDAVRQNIHETSYMRAGSERHVFKMVAGYLYK